MDPYLMGLDFGRHVGKAGDCRNRLREYTVAIDD